MPLENIHNLDHQTQEYLKVQILGGGLTPLGQPLDKVINKVWKGNYRDFYDEYALEMNVSASKPDTF